MEFTINVNDFDCKNIILGSVNTKQIPNSTLTYQEIAIEYNYGTENDRKLGPLYVEFNEVLTRNGISESKPQSDDPKAKSKFSIQCSIKPDDVVVKTYEKIYDACAEHLYNNRGPIKRPKFDRKNPEGSGFKNPVFYARDPVSFEPIPGKMATIYLQLLNRGSDRTNFLDLKERNLTWDHLKDVEMNFYPVVLFDKIYIGSSISIQHKVVSAIVKKHVKKSNINRQKSTLDRLRAEHPELLEESDKQYEALLKSNSSSPTLIQQELNSSDGHQSPRKTNGLSDFLNS